MSLLFCLQQNHKFTSEQMEGQYIRHDYINREIIDVNAELMD